MAGLGWFRGERVKLNLFAFIAFIKTLPPSDLFFLNQDAGGLDWEWNLRFEQSVCPRNTKQGKYSVMIMILIDDTNLVLIHIEILNPKKPL